MVSALCSSKMERTKRFTYDGVEFGWDCIEEMFAWDLQRAKTGLPRRVPGLSESYVYRDIWTRLNVKPAKIMQVGKLSAVCHCVCMYVCVFVFVDSCLATKVL